MVESYKINEFNTMNGARPCVYRGELELTTKYNPATPCCKENTQVVGAKFYCSLLNKYLDYNTSVCWLCKERKETLP